MRLTQKKIEEIITSVLGQEGLPLLKQLLGKENVSEFKLAEKIKRDIKVVRKMLYILYNHNLVRFNRKKDNQKGWYIYYWTLVPENLRFNYVKRKKEALARLEQQLESEKEELFFICPNKCVRLDFDQSMDFEFHCPECGELILQDSSQERIEMLQKRIKEISDELEKIKLQRKARRKKVAEKKKEVEKKAVAKAKKVVKKKTTKKTTSKKKTPAKKKTAAKKKATPKKKTATKAKKVVKKKAAVKKKVVKARAVAKKKATPKKKSSKKVSPKKPVKKKTATKKKVAKK